MKIIEKISKCDNDFENNPQPMIAFLGDSVTQGYFFDTTNYDEVYHNKVRQWLNLFYPAAPINILNSGLGGTRATFGAERIERDVISKKPDLCVVCFGLNDIGGLEEGITVFQKALSDIFTAFENAGIEIIYMTPNMYNTTYIPEKTPEISKEFAQIAPKWQNGGLMDKYVDAMRETAAGHNVPICDCYAIWKKLSENGVNTTRLLANGINHPLPKMHDLFAYELIRTMFG